ncbi:MAG TPA: hypothetical protein VIT65_27355 [Microlunatus sp.]
MVTVDDVRTVLAGLPRSSEMLVRDRVKFRVGQIVYVAFNQAETVIGFAFPKEERDAPWSLRGLRCSSCRAAPAPTARNARRGPICAHPWFELGNYRRRYVAGRGGVDILESNTAIRMSRVGGELSDEETGPGR